MILIPKTITIPSPQKAVFPKQILRTSYKQPQKLTNKKPLRRNFSLSPYALPSNCIPSYQSPVLPKEKKGESDKSEPEALQRSTFYTSNEL